MQPELKSKRVEIDGKSFDFKEPTIAAMLPILPLFSSPDTRGDAQLDLLKVTVFSEGEPLGDQVGELGWSLFMKMIPHALEVCGMQGDDDGA